MARPHRLTHLSAAESARPRPPDVRDLHHQPLSRHEDHGTQRRLLCHAEHRIWHRYRRRPNRCEQHLRHCRRVGNGSISDAFRHCGRRVSLSGVGNGATSDDGICAYGQPNLAVAGKAPIFGTASVGSERAQGFRDLSASVQKSWKLYETHELQFITEAYNVGNITS